MTPFGVPVLRGNYLVPSRLQRWNNLQMALVHRSPVSKGIEEWLTARWYAT